VPTYPSKPFISVRYTTSNTAQTGAHDMFDTTNYGGVTYVNASNGITYDATNGRFTMPEKGTYAIHLVPYFIHSVTGILTTYRFARTSGTTIWSASATVHSSVDPHALPAMFFRELEGDEWIRCEIDSATTNTLQTVWGSTMNIWKLD
jgi:hypothetical protein